MPPAPKRPSRGGVRKQTPRKSTSNTVRSRLLQAPDILAATAPLDTAVNSSVGVTTPPDSPAIPDASPPPFNFLKLPGELRLLVYKHMLVVGKVFYTPSHFEVTEGRRFKDIDRYAKPQLQILRVCRQLHHEAEPIYLTRNLFVLPHECCLYSPFRQAFVGRYDGIRSASDPPDRYLFSVRGLQLVRCVSVVLDMMGDTSIHPGMTRSQWDAERPGSTFSELSQLHRIRLAHKNANERLAMQWSFTLRSLALFSPLQTTITLPNGAVRPAWIHLQYLEIDLNNSFCAFGCCRMVYAKLDILRLLQPRMVRVLGTLGTDEQTWVCDVWARRMGMESQQLREGFGVRFGGRDPWDLWAVNTRAKKIEDVRAW